MSDQENPTPAESTAPTAPAAPAGWYDDPSTGGKRWWDGTLWAAATPAPDIAGPAATGAPAAKVPVLPLAVLALVGGGIAFLAGLFPVLGLILALGAGAIAIVALRRKQTPRWMPLVGIGLSSVAAITGIIVIASLAIGGIRPPAIVTASSPRPTEQQDSNTPEPVEEVAVPNVVGLTTADAISQLEAAGFEAKTEGQEGKVASQVPAAGGLAPKGSAVTIASVLDLTTFVTLTDREFAQLAKDPDSYAGQRVLMFGSVWQFDTATGTCNLLIDTAETQKTYSYDYGVNTWVTGTPCSVLDPVVEGDHVAIWTIIEGAYSYDTAMGGTNTAVAVDVVTVEILSPQEY